jgi:hypothetical protein
VKDAFKDGEAAQGYSEGRRGGDWRRNTKAVLKDVQEGCRKGKQANASTRWDSFKREGLIRQVQENPYND